MRSPVHLLRGIINLTSDEIERKLKNEEALYKVNNKWISCCVNNGIFLDLSQVRWCNLSAVTQLVLFVESAIKSNITVYVALPTIINTKKEVSSEHLTQEQKYLLLKGRKEANAFLKVVGFDEAVYCSHLKLKSKVFVTEEYEFEKHIDKDDELMFYEKFDRVLNPIGDKNYERYNYKYIYPLTWINCGEETADIEEIKVGLEKILSNKEKGLNSIDVLSLKNVVLSELIKNVREHSGHDTEYALISIGLINAKSLDYKFRRTKRLYDIEDDYIDWITHEEIGSQVEIYFGDSGKGLLSDKYRQAYRRHNDNHCIDDVECLKWAFDKWSTCKVDEEVRGTKGLYRINRIINKYNGLFHIRTGKVDGGYQKGGYESSVWKKTDSELYNMNGTYVQIKLCPYNEVAKFSFYIENNWKKRKWISVRYVINKYDNDSFDEIINKAIKTNDNVLLILDNENDVDDSVLQIFLEKKLALLSHLRHPNGVVVYIVKEIGELSVESIVDSINQIIVKEINNSEIFDISDPDYEDIYDPVLIIERNHNMYWFGGSQYIVDLLNEIIKPENNEKSLNDIKYYKELNDEIKNIIRIHFNDEDSLVLVTSEGKIVFNFSNIENHLESDVKRKIDNYSICDGKIKCTPRLKGVDKWYDLIRLIEDNKVSIALAFYLKTIEYCNKINKKIRLNNIYILIDHNMQKELAIEYSNLLGVEERNIICALDDIRSDIPRRTKLFDKGDSVVVLTTFISTSETVRKLVKYVRRDDANPIFILCIANFRKKGIFKLETWDESTDILSIIHYSPEDIGRDANVKNINLYKDNIDSIEKAKIYISPEYRMEKKMDALKDEYLLDKELENYIIKTKSLHYNHVGKFNDRHFTFYINKYALLKEKSLIWNKIDEALNSWIIEYGIDEFSICYPRSKDGGEGAFKNYIQYIKRRYKINNVFEVVRFRDLKIRDEYVFYMDIGSLTGKTLNKLMASDIEAKKIMICILFSQLSLVDKYFYESIYKTRRTKKVYKDNKQTDMFESHDVSDVYNVCYESTEIKIIFLYKFPLYYYTSENCPICEHKKALEYYRIDDRYMCDFYEDRKKRLKIRERSIIEALSHPCDFYHTEESDKYELSSETIMSMYKLKLLICKSYFNTQYRVRLYEVLLSLSNKVDKELKNCKSDIYSIIYLLSFEVYIFQKEPMSFRNIRSVMANIAIKVLLYDNKKLIDFFNISNDSDTEPWMILVRYKYSAITVLRSSNKYRFCQNLYEVIMSSVVNDVISDNLLQNTIYHISTIHQNKYNKSIKYFELIEDGLKKAEKSAFYKKLNNKQIVSFDRLTLANIRIKNERILEKEKRTPLKILKSLKYKVNEIYENKSHPEPTVKYDSMDFRLIGHKCSGIYSLREEKNKSEYYKNFKLHSEQLLYNWRAVSKFIEVTIMPHIELLPQKIKTIEPFEVYVNKIKYYQQYIKNRFEKIVCDISNDPMYIVKCYDIYNEYYDYIGDLFIRHRGNRGLKNACCDTIDILKQYPTEIVNIVNSIFSNDEYRVVKVEIDSKFKGKVLIYYPQVKFVEGLKHIKRNIQEKLDEGVCEKDVSVYISIASDKEYVVLSLKYDKTNKYKSVNKKGGLSVFRDEVQSYDGDLGYDKLDDIYFNVNIKFKKYE